MTTRVRRARLWGGIAAAVVVLVAAGLWAIGWPGLYVASTGRAPIDAYEALDGGMTLRLTVESGGAFGGEKARVVRETADTVEVAATRVKHPGPHTAIMTWAAIDVRLVVPLGDRSVVAYGSPVPKGPLFGPSSPAPTAGGG